MTNFATLLFVVLSISGVVGAPDDCLGNPWNAADAFDPTTGCGVTYPCFDLKSCCMETNYLIYEKSNGKGDLLSCGSNSVDFKEVTGMQVFDDGITYCNCGVCEPLVDCSAVPLHPSCECDPGPIDCAPLGEDAVDCDGLPWNTIFGACRGNDDYVDVSFTVNVDAKAEYDAGMYIATDGGHCKCVHLYCFCAPPFYDGMENSDTFSIYSSHYWRSVHDCNFDTYWLRKYC